MDQWSEGRRKSAKIYTDRLLPLGVVCPTEKKGSRHVYHLYTIQTEKRNSLQCFLKRKGIETLIHYPIAIPFQKAYKELRYRKEDFPVTHQWSRRTLSLPFFPEIKKHEMEEVADGIRSFFKKRM